jgi:hypothetical protein
MRAYQRSDDAVATSRVPDEQAVGGDTIDLGGVSECGAPGSDAPPEVVQATTP